MNESETISRLKTLSSDIRMLANVVSMQTVMLALQHPDPRFRAWGEKAMPDFWEHDFSLHEIPMEPGSMDTAIIKTPFDYKDLVTGNRIEIKTSPRYSILKVNEREYYFVRETGEFDGTGMPIFEPPTTPPPDGCGS